MELNHLDLNKLQVFLTVARARSMTAAAQTLLRTPSAVSQSVSSLERSLGVRLFRRVGIRLFLTPEGEELASGLARYQSDLERLLFSLPALQAKVSGEARLGLLPGFSSVRIGPLLTDLVNEFDGLKIRLKFSSHGELSEALLQDQLDLALTLMPLRKLRKNIESKKLFSEELVLVSSSDGPRLSLKRTDWETLPVIEYYQAPALYKNWVRHHTGRAPERQNVRVFASTLDYVLDLSRRGAGYAVVPLAVAVADPGLQIHRFACEQSLFSQVWLNYMKGGALSAPAEQLRSTLITHF